MTRKLIYKVYSETGTFKGILNDVVNKLSFIKTINGGLGQCIIRLDRKIDSYDQDDQITFNNRVQVYLTDDDNTDKLIYQGYITAYNPFLSDSEEYVEITCLGAISKLSNDFFRSGTTLEMSEGGTEIGQVLQNIIDNYRGLETNSMISNDYTNVGDTSKDISYTYKKMKHLEAMKKTAEFLDYDWYWFLGADGLLKLAQRTSGDHTFILKKDIRSLKVHKTIESVQNYFFFWNGLTADDDNYLYKQYSDATSQTAYDIIASQKADGRVIVEGTADEMGANVINANKDPKTRTTLVIGKEYDLASINPGDTCNIRNIDTSDQTTFADDLLIVRVNYTPDYALLELAEIKDNINEVLNTPSETTKETLDQLQDDINDVNENITIQGWQQDMAFSPSDYRVVAWTGGTITLSNNDTYNISAGNTGDMAALTYIYLDINTSITVLQTTTTPATAVGVGKILIAVAQNNTDTSSYATFQVFGGKGGVFLGVDNLAANSVSTNEFVANTANIKNAIISTAKIISLVANKITAGTGIINALSVLNTLTIGSSGTNGIIQSYGWNGTVNGFRILGGGTPSITLIGGTISAGTITGSLIKTATSGLRVEINTSGYTNKIAFYNVAGSLAGQLEGSVVGGTPILLVTGYLTTDQSISSGNHIFTGPTGKLYIGSTLAATTLEQGGSSELVANRSFIPDTNDSFDLGGTSTSNWRRLYISDSSSYGIYFGATKMLYMNGGDLTFGADLDPGTLNTYTLGSSGQAWKDLHLQGGLFFYASATTTQRALHISSANTANLYCDKHFVPVGGGSTCTLTVGSDGDYWHNMYSDDYTTKSPKFLSNVGLEIIKKIKVNSKTGKIDSRKDKLPKELLGPDGSGFGLGNGLMACFDAIKQLEERLLKVE